MKSLKELRKADLQNSITNKTTTTKQCNSKATIEQKLNIKKSNQKTKLNN